jgi:hypothetical protein
MAERSSTGQRAGDCLVANALVSERAGVRVKAIIRHQQLDGREWVRECAAPTGIREATVRAEATSKPY